MAARVASWDSFMALVASSPNDALPLMPPPIIRKLESTEPRDSSGWMNRLSPWYALRRLENPNEQTCHEPVPSGHSTEIRRTMQAIEA